MSRETYGFFYPYSISDFFTARLAERTFRMPMPIGREISDLVNEHYRLLSFKTSPFGSNAGSLREVQLVDVHTFILLCRTLISQSLWV